MNVLVLEPYLGGSHRRFLEGLAAHLPFAFDILGLPARMWKWRMRFSAPYFAAKLPVRRCHDRLLCSTFVDVAALRGLGPSWLAEIPILTYFHENQFAYPVRKQDERDLHFAVTNTLTAAASNRVAFNSRYNRDSLLAGCREICSKSPDMKIDLSAAIREKSEVLYPPVDFADIDCSEQPPRSPAEPPVIIWNHRWEHDKNPESFFQALFALREEGVDFRLVLLGQSFLRQPDVFAEAIGRLGKLVVHAGFVHKREEYARWLRRGDVVVSTANHEFYGIAVIEAVRAGCRPLLPNRLSYPELFPGIFLYEEENFLEALRRALQLGRLDETTAHELTQGFSWDALGADYQRWFAA